MSEKNSEYLASKEAEAYDEKPARDAELEKDKADEAYWQEQDRLRDLEDGYDEEDNEDPLAGDVDPTGGYYEEPLSAFDAHMDAVHKMHGN